MARGWHLERWQTLLAAGIAAVASIVVAIIGFADDDSESSAEGQPTESSSSTSSPNGSGGDPEVAITSWEQSPMPPPPGQRYVFKGFARNLSEEGSSYIFVVARRPSSQPDEESPLLGDDEWLVSPMAVAGDDGRWAVEWGLPNPPAAAEWIAVVWLDICPTGACGGNPYAALAAEGPEAADVDGFAPAPPGISPPGP
jgi:hypothetical protein